MRRTCAYLKFHRHSFNSLRCLQYWSAVFKNRGIEYFLLCDLEPPQLPSLQGAVPLKSDTKLRQRLAGKLAANWVNAGAAHLTCFTHSLSNGFTDFWNIDADDTIFFASPNSIADGLRKVEDYSNLENIDSISLDMYQTFQWHWSFGVAFTRNTREYQSLLDSISADTIARAYPTINGGKPFIRNEDGLPYCLPGYNGNIDWYFTLMRDRQDIEARSFYFEDSYFAHVGIFGYDTIGQLTNGTYYWSKGRLWDRPINADCIRFDL